VRASAYSEVGRVYLRECRRRRAARFRSPGYASRCVSAPPPWPGARRAVGQPARGWTFFDVKADLENLVAPLPCASSRQRIPLSTLAVGRVLVDASRRRIGDAAPEVAAEVRAATAAGALRGGGGALGVGPASRPEVPSKYPPVVRDMALLSISNTPVQAFSTPPGRKTPPSYGPCGCLACIAAKVCLPEKSLAFRVVMQHTERTLRMRRQMLPAMRW